MEQRNDVFDQNRRYLFGLAYRMVGSAADAEDLVQDCWLRWQQAPAHDSIESPRAYLTTTLTRLCINHMQSARVRREEYVGPWLPEPVVTSGTHDPAEMAESLTTAFLVLLESLAPVERAVFLLAEVFGYDAEETGRIVDKSAANVRQILHRARTAVQQRRPRFPVEPEAAAPLLRRFRDALQTGDVTGMVAVLHSDAVLYSDGGGKVKSALNPLHGADKVARFFAGIVSKGALEGIQAEWTEINGQPGVIGRLSETGEPVNTMAFDIEDGRIRTIYIVSNPDKLQTLGEAAQKC